MRFMRNTAIIYGGGIRMVLHGFMDTPYSKAMVERYAKDDEIEKFMEMG